MKLHNELPVYKATYDLLLDVFKFTKEFGKEYKYTVGESLKKHTIDLLTLIYRANSRKDKQEVLQEAREGVELTTYVSTVNSYLGIMKHFKTYRLRSSMLRKRIGGRWHQHIFVSSDKLKIVKRVRKNYSNRTPLFVHYGRR